MYVGRELDIDNHNDVYHIAVRLLCKLVFAPAAQDIMYGVNWDNALKMCVKNGEIVTEFFARDDVKYELDKLSEETRQFFGVTLTPDGSRRAPEELASEASLHGVATGFNLSKEMASSLAGDDHADNIKEVLETRWKLVEKINTMDDGAKDQLYTFERKAMQVVADHVQLIVEGSSATLLSKQLADTFAGTQRGDDKKVLIIYDNKLAGEAQTTPHLRVPPLQVDRLKKMIQAINMTRDGGHACIDDGDIFMIFDAMQQGNKALIYNQFVTQDSKALTKSVQTLHIHYSEDAMESRYARVKENIVLNQLEGIHIVTPGIKLTSPELMMDFRKGIAGSLWVYIYAYCLTKCTCVGVHVYVDVGVLVDADVHVSVYVYVYVIVHAYVYVYV